MPISRASGFLLKGGELADLVYAIKVIAAGDALLSPSVTRNSSRHRDLHFSTSASHEYQPRQA
jgi:DNA-binding NarL/FixJ family response regulator